MNTKKFYLITTLLVTTLATMGLKRLLGNGKKRYPYHGINMGKN